MCIWLLTMAVRIQTKEYVRDILSVKPRSDSSTGCQIVLFPPCHTASWHYCRFWLLSANTLEAGRILIAMNKVNIFVHLIDL